MFIWDLGYATAPLGFIAPLISDYCVQQPHIDCTMNIFFFNILLSHTFFSWVMCGDEEVFTKPGLFLRPHDQGN
jgi:hypothetical protein